MTEPKNDNSVTFHRRTEIGELLTRNADVRLGHEPAPFSHGCARALGASDIVSDIVAARAANTSNSPQTAAEPEL